MARFDSMLDSVRLWILAARVVRATWLYSIVYMPTALASVLHCSRLDNIEGAYIFGDILKRISALHEYVPIPVG